MKLKKIMAAALTAALMFGVLTAPETGLEVKAAETVYTNNQATGIPSANIQTPQETVRLYSGLSWQLLEAGIGVRLNVTDSGCGPLARRALTNMAATLRASEVKTLDMRLEKYLKSGGWTQTVKETTGKIRVCIALPAGSDPTRDYAVISLRDGGAVEVLGDLDPDPATITVDSDCFDTFMIVSGPAGAFDAYRVASPNALDALEIPVYVKKIGSTVKIEKDFPMGVLTDPGQVNAATGGRNVRLQMTGVIPGDNAKYALDNAIKQTNALNKRKAATKEDKSDEVIPSYFEMEMLAGSDRITNTNGKLRITMAVPYDFPAYADYAVAVLNMDGTVTIMKDIDENESTITIDTDQFRTYAFLWGRKGAFD